MKDVISASALAAMLLAFPASAQSLSPISTVAAGNAVLTVTGEGRSLRAPDLAIFNAGVTTQGETAAKALAENSAAMKRIIDQLRQAGIANRDIQTSNLTVEPIYSDPRREAELAARYNRQPYVPPPPEDSIPKILSYRVSNSVSVRQRDLNNFGSVIDTLVAAGANQVNGPSFVIDNPDLALDEARIDAVQKSRQRAELYARTAGLKIAKVVSINEGAGYYGQPPVVFVTGRALGNAPPPPPPPPAPVQPGEMQITASVTLVYELEPAGREAK